MHARGRAALCAVVVSLVLGGTANAIQVGANDDTGKFADDGGAVFFERMRTLGLKQTVMTVRFDPAAPLVIQNKAFIDKAITEAGRQGLSVVLAVYPYPPRSLVRSAAGAQAFAEYVARVAREYPAVRQFVIGNEPNQPAFWRPQLSAKGKVLSAPMFGQYLAAAYDALKVVDLGITVVGVGLSPRGNDNPRAKSNLSTSPARFLAALGAWYRKSGRTAPLMDGFSFHPYPRAATDALTAGYAWPNVGFTNLDRLKQAIHDAFHDTPQPTTVDGLKLYLDEVGWQVDTSSRPGYTGLENVPVTTEAKQAATYAELIKRAACDPDIEQLNIFGFYDDVSRDQGFQAALHRVDGTPRPAAAAVAAAVARTDARPCARPVVWEPLPTVAGADLSTPKRQASGAINVLVGAQEGAKAVVCAVEASAMATRRPASGASLQRRALAKCWRGTLTPRFRRLVKLRIPEASRDSAVIAAYITAESNAERVAQIVKEPQGP